MRAGIFELPKKKTVIRLRWLVVFVCSYLLLYSQGGSYSLATTYSFVLFYILSNAALYLIDERKFESSYFYAPLILFDTFCVTGSLMVSGQAGTDFYLVYFVIIILCAVLQDFYGSVVVAILSTLVYSCLLYTITESMHPSIYLRLPFLFVVSLFYGYFAEISRTEKRLKERAEKHRIVADRLADAERLKTEFLRNTTHELRTPLTTIMGFSGLLREGAFGSLKEEQIKAVDRITESARGLLGMVEQILDCSRLEKGEISLVTARQDLAPLLDEIRYELGPLEAHRPYRIQYEIDRDVSPIETDWEKLKGILLNVLSNALKFTDQGEVKLSVWRKSRQEVSFEVSDTGIGIPSDKIPQIFKKFHQLDGSQARTRGGTGLGLALCRNLVELLGGKLEVESQVGKGSTFRVTIMA